MIVIGERINGTRKRIAQALKERDAAFIQKEATTQVEAGADIIDVNCGASGPEGSDLMAWLVRTVRQATDVPLSIDSSEPDVVRAGLRVHGDKMPMVNSTNAVEETMRDVMALYTERPFLLVALPMEAGSIPSTPEERVAKAEKIAHAAAGRGIPLSQIFVDPLMQPVSYETRAGLVALETLSRLKRSLPEIRSIVGLSNISYGLPCRSLLNRTMLAMLLGAGLDSAIVDPCVVSTISEVRAAEVLLGQDEMCLRYIESFREGKIQG